MPSQIITQFPENHAYTFLDEATGLFWTGELKDRGQALFAPKGIEYRNRKAAEESWRNYEITRATDPRQLPELIMLVHRIERVEVARLTYDPAPESLRLTRFTKSHGKMDRLTGFIRGLSERPDFMEFQYIVQRTPPRKVSGSMPNAMRKGEDIDLAPLRDAVLSSRKSARKFIAVRNDEDLLYLRMSLGEGFSHAYNLDTGEKV